jgi:dipeptidyl aminopeptidase/acylaminoacyl peptidase
MKASRALPFALAALAVGAVAQDRKPTLKLTDYGQWERLGQGVISDDGHWYGAGVTRVDKMAALTIRNVDGPENSTIPYGSQLSFSDDSKWAAFMVGVSPEQAEKLAAQKKRPEPKFVIKNLSEGSDRVFDAALRGQFVKGSRFAAVQMLPSEGQTGGDFSVLDLAKQKPALNLSGVTQFAVNEPGSLIAVVVASSSGYTGLQVLDPARKTVDTIYWSRNKIRGFTWSEDGNRLAWMEAMPKEGKVGDDHAIHAASFQGGEIQVEDVAFTPKEGDRITETDGLEFSRNGSRLAFSVAKWPDRVSPTLKPNEISNVEIWNTHDVDQVPLQRSQAGAEMTRASVVVYDLDKKKASPPQDLKWRNYRLLDGFDWALAEDRDKHAVSVKPNGLEYSDAVAINVWTGETRPILSKAINNVGGMGVSTILASPHGRYVAWFEDEGWRIHDFQTGETKTASAPKGETFADTLDDNTLPSKPVNGGFWLADDKALILYSDNDVFRANPRTGEVEQLTDGRKDHMRCRIVDLDTNKDGVDADEIYFALFDTKTKGNGVAKLQKDGEIKPLMWHDAGVGQYRRSRGTDRVVFRMQTFQQSPNDYVTNLAFSAAKPLTNTNPQQANYAWGKAELVDYKIKDGTELQGTLYYPANYEPGRFYPMITYIYEKLSDGFHQYQVPSLTNYYDLQHYSQNGYFVFQPDITYKRRNPGLSAVECIEAGVNAVLAKKIGVDATKLGLTGHSWGAYQTVFTSTHSKLFSCYVAGAPLTELITMSNSTYWNWGQSNQVIFESSQGRMEVAWYEDMKSYIDNSPLFHAQNITAPMLVECGTADGAVDWTQSQFLYATLRRMGKNMVMIVYPDENHGLAVEANMKDCSRRYQHFFDVYLKGRKPEEWVTRGVPYIDLDKERERSAKESGAGKKTLLLR